MHLIKAAALIIALALSEYTPASLVANEGEMAHKAHIALEASLLELQVLTMLAQPAVNRVIELASAKRSSCERLQEVDVSPIHHALVAFRATMDALDHLTDVLGGTLPSRYVREKEIMTANYEVMAFRLEMHFRRTARVCTYRPPSRDARSASLSFI